jgi:HEAT repeat protein
VSLQPALRAAFHDGDPVVRLWAATALWRFAPEATEPAAVFLESLDRPEAREQLPCCCAKVGQSAALLLEPFLARLDSPDREIRATVADALWRTGLRKQDDQTLRRLHAALADDVRNVQRYAISALGAWGPAAALAVPELLPFLEDDSGLQEEAVRALGAIGPAAQAAVPALRALLATLDQGDGLDLLLSGEAELRRTVEDALRQIESTN